MSQDEERLASARAAAAMEAALRDAAGGDDELSRSPRRAYRRTRNAVLAF
jgi:hypothetical protein